MEVITSRQNPRLKNLVKLRERSHRQHQEKFLVEGVREVSMALHNGFTIEEVFLCEDLLRAHDAIALRAEIDSTEIERAYLSAPAFEKVTLRENPDGILAVCTKPELVIDQLQLPENPLLVIIDGVEKPGNVGAIVRSAEAAGAHAVVIADQRGDAFAPFVIRNSRGLVFALPVLCESPDYLAGWLKRRNWPIIAADPEAGSLPWQTRLDGPAAVVLGSEHDGLSAFWKKVADVGVRIPLAGQADSLNVSATAAILLFEAVRQRTRQGTAI
ncbi:MAG: TrmH family RNA methyltransferase [Opitutales bacterium]